MTRTHGAGYLGAIMLDTTEQRNARIAYYCNTIGMLARGERPVKRPRQVIARATIYASDGRQFDGTAAAAAALAYSPRTIQRAIASGQRVAGVVLSVARQMQNA